MKQKGFKLDAEILSALRLAERETGKPMDELVKEAFALLFAKHGVPRDLKEALRLSLRKFPTNDNTLDSVEAGAG